MSKRNLAKTWQAICESTKSDNWGIYTKMGKSEKLAVLIDMHLLAQAWSEKSETELQPGVDARDVIDAVIFDSQCISGIIMIAEPDAPCNGAWEVKATAVKDKGTGSYVYSMGYWMSPTNSLIPDRSSLSKHAIAAWEKASKKMQGQPIDNVHRPRNTDPNDDCEEWHEDENAAANKDVYKSTKDSMIPSMTAIVNKTYKMTPVFDCEAAVKRLDDTVDQFISQSANSGASHLEKKEFSSAFHAGGLDLFQRSILWYVQRAISISAFVT